MEAEPQVYSLRQHTHSKVGDNAVVLDLPIVFIGREEDCHAYALEHGFKWAENKSILFGGYYVNSEGDTIYLT